MADDELTPGEIRRTLARIEGQMVSKEVFQIGMANVHQDISELKRNADWGRRAMITSVLFPLVVLVVGALIVSAVT